MYYRICDVKKANYEVDDLQSALTAAAQTQLKEVFGLMAFHEALECQDFINDYLVREFSSLFEKWGVEVLRMELIGLNTSDSHGAIAQTMKKQMIAERDRRAKYIATEGQKAASLLIAEGVKKVAHILGLAEQESTKKISEGHASATVVLAHAEKSSLDAITAVTAKEKVTLSDYFQTQNLLKAMRFKAPATMYLPFTLAPFSKLLFLSVPTSFGMPKGLRNRSNKRATTMTSTNSSKATTFGNNHNNQGKSMSMSPLSAPGVTFSQKESGNSYSSGKPTQVALSPAKAEEQFARTPSAVTGGLFVAPASPSAAPQNGDDNFSDLE